MSALTGVLYALLLAYLGGWYMGQWSGNFALLLFIPDDGHLRLLAGRALPLPAGPQGRRAGPGTATPSAARPRPAKASSVDGDIEGARQTLLPATLVAGLDGRSLPGHLGRLPLRSFVVEPFKILSGSMVPTLMVGDLILVNKFHYGIRLPVINKKIIANHDVQRGDVMVFRYPDEPGAGLHQARGRHPG